jgi:hypothetical protein
MKIGGSGVDPEIRALLEHSKSVRPLPDVVRARALERARAAMMTSPAPAGRAARVAVSAGWPWLRVAAAAAVFLALVAAGAVAAFRGRVPFPTELAPSSTPRVPPAVRAVAPAPRPVSPPVVLETTGETERPARAARPRESYAAELRLLQRAQAAYAGGDFADAMGVLAEHARRFPKGRLAEERDALRVRALVGAGRTPEARRAAAAFANRFPRSVLLPRLKEMLSAAK